MSRNKLIAVIAGQLSQKSTITAIVSAAALVGGWTVAPDRIDAIATLVGLVDSVVLAVLQESPTPLTVKLSPEDAAK